ncbi:universal stress protein [Salinactinospora qingdaonensis]|uniref:Universal stress protein n=1 Tax=Salinactinospora qingdaonensis TaxID=702744 RepID=A0ABP7GPJ9_9ACTN
MSVAGNESHAQPAESHGVVVGVDGSEPSRAALDWAAQAAVHRGVGLTVLYAMSMPLIATPFGHPTRVTPTPEVADRASTLLNSAVEHVKTAHPHLSVHTQLSEIEPAPAMLAAAKHADLVVVGSRGHGGAASLFLGSVSVRLASHAACPVVVVPPDSTTLHQPRGRVVVGVDGSAASATALRFALEEAALRDADLTALRAWQPAVPFDPMELAAVEYTVDRESLVARATKYVHTIVEEARSEATRSVPVHVVMVEEHPAQALLTESHTADLIVVGSRGRGGFRGLLLGSVSQAVLHHAAVPVMVTRADVESAHEAEPPSE